MNSKEKTIHVNASSLVDLKAELLRKQDEFKKARLASRVIRPKSQTKKASIWSKQNAGVLERAQHDAEVKQEEKTDDKARAALEAKAKLYDLMTSGQALEDGEGNERFLVDFERKAVSTLLEKRDEEKRRREEEMKRKEEEEEAEEERRRLAEAVPPSDNPDEQWVDFVDGFGRERRCLRKDLPALKKMDESITKSARTKSADEQQEPELLSTDMRRELQRQKWEQEQEEMLSEQPTVHYANVQYDEIRAHGVGYYQFSKKETERGDQLKMLDELRQQTLENRTKKERMLEKRKAIMKVRLAKVKQRRLQREGKTMEDEDNTEEDDWLIGPPKPDKPSKPEPLTRDDSLKTGAPMRDWDRGKPVVETAPNWLEDQRAEREPEFAPPQMYYGSAPKTAARGKNKTNPSRPKTGKQDREETSMGDMIGKVIGEGLSAIRAGMDGGRLKADVVTSIPLPGDEGGDEGGSHPSEQEGTMDSDVRIPPYSLSEMPAWEVPAVASTMNQNNVTSSCSSNMQASTTNWPHFPTDTGNPMPTCPSGMNMAMPPPCPGDMNMSMPPPCLAGINMSIPPCPAGANMTMPPHPPGMNMSIPPPCPPGMSMPMPPSGIDMSVPPPIGAPWTMPPPPPSTPAHTNPTPQDTTAQYTCSTDALGPAPPVEHGEQPTASSIQPPAPQPAHYTSAPQKPQQKQGHYERVNMHQVPMSLPLPPIIGQEVTYASQESIFGKKPEKREEDGIKYWKQQFGGSQPRGGAASTRIPFPAPNVKRKTVANDGAAVADFDLSKPPPSTEK